VKTYIHARLSQHDRAVLDELKSATGHNESELVRRGLKLVSEQLARKPSALDVAGQSVGKFKNGPSDLSTNRKHLEGFGE
jgi:Arc/MetJ-type ribon-helix-helix transcriptional regulator